MENLLLIIFAAMVLAAVAYGFIVMIKNKE